MQTFDDIVQILDAIVFGALALLVYAQWRRRADAPSGWLVATFGTLGAVLVLAFFVPEEPQGRWEEAFLKVLILGIVLYPWFLFRFMAAFEPPPRTFVWIGRLLTAATAVATLFLPSLPAENEPRPVWFELYTLLLVLQWGFLTAWWWPCDSGGPAPATPASPAVGCG